MLEGLPDFPFRNLERLCLVHGLLPFPVGQWPRPNNAAPSLQPHYRTFLATTGCVVRPWPLANRKREEPVDEAKPFKQRLNIGSRVTREGHARFWERPEVKFLRATRRVSRAPYELSAARNCTKDEGGPFEFGDQEPISSHRKL